jgi:general secretion pathway protein K
MRTARTAERGAALLIVMVAVAVLTALAADLAYEARVSLQIAANERNDLQATYLAKSGVVLGRLVLNVQKEIDQLQSPVQGIPMPRPQLWKIAPVGPELADALLGGAPRSRPETGAAAAGGPASGSFDVQIDDEGRKVNAQLEALNQTGSLLPAQVQALWQVICDPRWDPLFDKEDGTGQRYSRADLLINLRDWVDEDAVSSALAASFSPNSCQILVPAVPFESGFGDENRPYDRGEDRYRAKNARMDSLDELYLVAGIGDAFMAAFGDQLTVYLARDEKQNVNTMDPEELRRLAQQMASPPDQPKLNDPLTIAALVKLVTLKSMGGILTYSPAELAQMVQAVGITVDQAKVTAQSAPFTDSSNVFRLRSAGRAGDVKKTLDVIVRMDKPQGVVVTPGKIMHWREE